MIYECTNPYVQIIVDRFITTEADSSREILEMFDAMFIIMLQTEDFSSTKLDGLIPELMKVNLEIDVHLSDQLEHLILQLKY